MTRSPFTPAERPSDAMAAGLSAFIQADAAARKSRERRAWLREAPNPLELTDRLIECGVPADVNRPLTFEGRGFWRDIYGALSEPRGVVMSSAQVGKSIMLFYAIATICLLQSWRGMGGWMGLYLPTMDMVNKFSQGRLAPILRAVAEHTGARAGGIAQDRLDPGVAATLKLKEKKGEAQDSLSFKRVGLWYVLLGWLLGKGVDGFPLDWLLLDEVRLMDPGRVDRVEKRVLGSALGHIFWTSTAGMPGDAIDFRWEQSDQRKWHHACRCPDGVVLAETWPNCLGTRAGKAAELHGRYFLHCPRCGDEIADRQAGRWQPHNPEGTYKGFSPNQLMTRLPVERIVEEWNKGNRRDFFNQVLGLTYLDKEACPIDLDVLNNTVNTDLFWARPGDARRTAMGIDQMAGVNYYVITSRSPDGLRRLVHLEIGWDDDPFARAAELMRAYDVSICCVEPLPNANDALRFVRAFPGRVWLVTYARDGEAGDPVQWKDRDPTEQERKNAALRTKYRVRVVQRDLMDALATHWQDRQVEVPSPRALLQEVLDPADRPFTVELCREVYFDHLQRIARRKVEEERLADDVDVPEKTGIVRYHWVKLAKAPSGQRPANVKGAASDPHFAYADLMNFLAWTRLRQAGWKPNVQWG